MVMTMFIKIKERTCNRHLILSPGAIIAVVKTPANIPAFPICGSLYCKKQIIIIFF